MQTQAALFRKGSEGLTIEPVDLDEPRPDEIHVRMVGTGICHTDMLMMELADRLPISGPAVLGHEGAGVVEAVGRDVTDLAVGDSVTLSMGFCGSCPRCVTGHPMYCDAGRTLNFGFARADGSSPISQSGQPIHGNFFSQSSFASHAIAPANAAVKLDPDVPAELMGPMGCGLQTGAGAVFNILKPPAASGFAVFGAGSVGLAGLMAARIAGCDPIIAIDPVESRRALAAELGATHTVDPLSEDPVALILHATGQEGAATALDTTTKKAVIGQMIDALAPFGRGGIAGIEQAGSIEIGMGPIMRGITLHGVMEGDSIPRLFIPQLVRLWQAGRFPFERMVRFYPFADINQAMADSLSGAAIKPILRFDA